MNINQNWIERCHKIESESEKLFKESILSMGWRFLGFASQKDDMFNHIDCYAKDADGNKISFDIKGLKREIANGKVLVELVNVQGKRGWLFGKAQKIALQVGHDKMIFIDRAKLYQLVKSTCGIEVFTKGGFDVLMTGKRVSNIADAINSAWYRREDRPKEKVVFLPLDKVMELV